MTAQMDNEIELEQNEIYVLKDATEWELKRINKCVHVEQNEVDQCNKYIATLQDELSEPNANAAEYKAALVDLHTRFKENKARQAQLRDKVNALFDIDDRVPKLRAQKEHVIECIVNILSNPASPMRTKLLEQEESVAVTHIEDSRYKLDQLQTEQLKLQQALQSINASIALHHSKEDALMITISEANCKVTECNIQEHEIQCELGRLESVEHLQTQNEQIKECTSRVNRLTHECDILTRDIDKQKKLILATRQVIETHEAGLANAQCELLATQDMHALKQAETVKIDDEKNELTKGIAVKDQDRRSNTRLVYEFRDQAKVSHGRAKHASTEIEAAEQALEDAKMEVMRAEDGVGASEAHLALKPRNRTFIENVTNAKKVLVHQEEQLVRAKERLDKLRDKHWNYQQQAAEAEDHVSNVQSTMRKDKEILQGLQKDLHDVKKRLCNTNTLAVDAQSKVSMLDIEVQTIMRLMTEGQVTLRENWAELLRKERRRKEATQDLLYESITLKHLQHKHNICTTYHQELEAKTKSLVLECKGYRKSMNEATGKLAQMRQRIANLLQSREKQAKELMALNYEIYLSECTQSLFWLAMKLLTKDLEPGQKLLAEEGFKYCIVEDDLESKLAEVAASRNEISEISVHQAHIRRQINDVIASLPPPLTSIYRKTLLQKDASNAVEFHRLLLSDYALRQVELEEELHDFDYSLNALTVEGAMQTPTKKPDTPETVFREIALEKEQEAQQAAQNAAASP